MKGIESAFFGVIGKDPELKHGKNGKPFCNFSCAVTSEAGDSQWLNVICFGDIAEKLAELARNGDRVYCEGHLTLAKWENSEGEARSGLAVSAWKVEKLGCIGRNRVRQPEEPPSAALPIVLPAKKEPAFGLFRKKAKPKSTTEDLLMINYLFDDRTTHKLEMKVESMKDEKPQKLLLKELTAPVHYINSQWAVTGYGVECITSEYPIKADRLCEKRGFGPDSSMPDWPMHMADKNWVDINLFVDAFERALSIHEVKHEFLPNWKERLEIWMEGRRPQEH